MNGLLIIIGVITVIVNTGDVIAGFIHLLESFIDHYHY